MRVFLLPKRTKQSQSKAFVSSFGAHPCSFSRISTRTFGQKPECRVNLVQQSPLCVDSNAHINTRMLQRKCRGISQIRCHSRINPLSLAAAAAAVYKRRAVLEYVHFFFFWVPLNIENCFGLAGYLCSFQLCAYTILYRFCYVSHRHARV